MSRTSHADTGRWWVSLILAVGVHAGLCAAFAGGTPAAAEREANPPQSLVWVDVPAVEPVPRTEESRSGTPVLRKAEPGPATRAPRPRVSRPTKREPAPAQLERAVLETAAASPTSLANSVNDARRENPSEHDPQAALGHDGALAARGENGTGAWGPAGTGARAPSGGHAEAPLSARLIAQTARCSDLFPHDARIPHARVTLGIDVSPTGRARRSRVIAVSPHDEAFHSAARLCAERLRFLPAQDDLGRAVASHAVVRLGFRRN